MPPESSNAEHVDDSFSVSMHNMLRSFIIVKPPCGISSGIIAPGKWTPLFGEQQGGHAAT